MPIKQIGRFMIGWERRNASGLRRVPWQELTLDRLEEETRQVVAKVARSAARDFFEEMQETFWEAVRTDLGRQVQQTADTAVERALGATTAPADASSLLSTVPAQKSAEPHVDSHLCAGVRVNWCHASCNLCADAEGFTPTPCPFAHRDKDDAQ